MWNEWNMNLEAAPDDKLLELKCKYMDATYTIKAYLGRLSTRNRYRGEVAEEYKNTELEEMFYRSAVLAWRWIT